MRIQAWQLLSAVDVRWAVTGAADATDAGSQTPLEARAVHQTLGWAQHLAARGLKAHSSADHLGRSEAPVHSGHGGGWLSGSKVAFVFLYVLFCLSTYLLHSSKTFFQMLWSYSNSFFYLSVLSRKKMEKKMHEEREG